MRTSSKFLPPDAQLPDVDADDLAGRFRQICYDLVDELVEPMSGAPDCIAASRREWHSGRHSDERVVGVARTQDRTRAREVSGTGPRERQIGAYKPSAEAFRKLETALGVDSSNLWYVGDNPANDIAGARAYGLRAVWFNRDGQDYPAGLEPATAVIEDLAELWAIVRGT